MPYHTFTPPPPHTHPFTPLGVPEGPSQWRRDPVGGGGKKKTKSSYRTVEQLKANGKLDGPHRHPLENWLRSRLGGTRVIDMIDREQQVYYSYSQMTNKLSVPEAPKSVAAHEQKTSGFALPELEHNLQLLIDLKEQDILQSSRRLQYERDVVVILSHESSSLGYLAAAVVHPLIREKLYTWDPLKDSSYGLEEVGQWRAILESGQLHHANAPEAHMDPYHRLLWEVWIPVLRVCVSGWQPRMVDCVEVWAPLDTKPPPGTTHLPQVGSWNPLTDSVPIHTWLPLLQSRLEPLYPSIRSKLANALQRWHPSDGSARLILQPWRDVFTPGAWEAFMVKNIIPKLALCLGDLLINPHQQQMKTFNWMLDWEGMLSPSCLVTLLDKHYFPKWLQVLCSWLSNSPNYEEITRWYLGWKSMFSDAVLAHPLKGKQERRDAASVAQCGIGASLSTNDLIQTKAEENNIVFMPLVAKQLYTFGHIIIYIGREDLGPYVPTESHRYGQVMEGAIGEERSLNMSLEP
uniref:GCF C-terminal domain-containing protein n=1 Tax=Oncorhynchus mykiss TaxID=8022 RepID=A0A8C7PQF1_ONCMY